MTIVDGRSAAQARRQDRRAATSSIRRHTGEVIIESGQKITKNAGRDDLHRRRLTRRRGRCSRTPSDPLIFNRSRKTPRPATKRPCCGSTSGCGRAIRRSWRRPRSCSTRSSSTPTATGWARSAGSASTASSNQNVPEDGDDAAARGPDRRDPLHAASCAATTGGRDRRHRPPGQPPAADDRRTGRRRAAQGLPQAPPHRAGADEPQGRRGHDAPQR